MVKVHAVISGYKPEFTATTSVRSHWQYTDGGSVIVGAGDGAGVMDGACDVDGAGVIVGASVLPRKPPHAQHWRLATKSSSS